MEFSDGDVTNQGEGRAWVTQMVQGCKHALRQRGTGRCWQPRGQALTLPPHCPPGSASLWDPHLRLTAPHAPDRQEGGHGAGPRRPREGGGEQRRPLQPPLPGRDPPPPLAPALPTRACPGHGRGPVGPSISGGQAPGPRGTQPAASSHGFIRSQGLGWWILACGPLRDLGTQAACWEHPSQKTPFYA